MTVRRKLSHCLYFIVPTLASVKNHQYFYRIAPKCDFFWSMCNINTVLPDIPKCFCVGVVFYPEI